MAFKNKNLKGWAIKEGGVLYVNTIQLTKKECVNNFLKRYPGKSWIDWSHKMSCVKITVSEL